MEETATKIDVLESTDYFFILKELENLVNYTSESEIIREIFVLLNKLFSPRQIAFIDYSNDLNGELTYCHTIDADNLQKDPLRSFTIEILHRDIFIGVFEIYDVRSPEYIDAYKKIGAIVCSICRVALISARKYEIIQTQKEQLQIYSNHLTEMIHTKDMFFSIIAHDLRGPLSSFLGLTIILADDFSRISFREIRKMITKMKNNAVSLFGLLDNLLEWARSQQGLIIFKPEMLDVQSVMKDSVRIFRNEAINKNISISCSIPKDLKVYVDLKMLQMVLRNMVSNGLKFTPKGGKIMISANIMDYGMVRISIRDTGIGIPAHMLHNLFSVKEKTSRIGTEGEPSTGLGLILCKEFVEKQGGSLWVESEEGKGSTFSITLPAKKEIEPTEN
jgi:signal transduction histidine kinase